MNIKNTFLLTSHNNTLDNCTHYSSSFFLFSFFVSLDGYRSVFISQAAGTRSMNIYDTRVHRYCIHGYISTALFSVRNRKIGLNIYVWAIYKLRGRRNYVASCVKCVTQRKYFGQGGLKSSQVKNLEGKIPLAFHFLSIVPFYIVSKFTFVRVCNGKRKGGR